MKIVAKILWSYKYLYNRFQEWQRSGLFESMLISGLVEYDTEKGIEWE